jgi:hypothetical protein
MMSQHAQPTLLIERIQPGWLRTAAQRWLYLALMAMLTGLVASLPGGVIGAIRGEALTGLLVGMAVAVPLIRGIARIEPIEALHWSWKNALKGIGIGLVAGLAGGLMGACMGGAQVRSSWA